MTTSSVVTEPAPQRRLCGAKKRQGEGTCARPAGWGTDHVGSGSCKLHGGSTAAGRTSAARQEARAMVQRFSSSVEISPEDALYSELSRTNGAVLWLAERLARPYDQEDGPMRRAADVRDYHGERDRLARVAKLCIDANLAERQLRLAEHQAAAIVSVITAVLTRLDVIDHPQATTIVKEELVRMAEQNPNRLGPGGAS